MDFERAKEVYTDSRIKNILEGLAEPFDPEDIYWKPQATNKDKTKAMAAAYADPRAYSDRLNAIVGANGWTCTYVVSTIAPAGPSDQGKFGFNGKVLVVATVTVNGVGVQSGTGESEATDDNAMTAAEAQGFKRAATRFGLGRYLYDLPKGQWCDYDSKSRKIINPPTLPEWAIPKKICADCKAIIEPYQHGNNIMSVTDLVLNSQKKYKSQLCAPCQKTRAKAVGVGIEATRQV